MTAWGLTPEGARPRSAEGSSSSLSPSACLPCRRALGLDAAQRWPPPCGGRVCGQISAQRGPTTQPDGQGRAEAAGDISTTRQAGVRALRMVNWFCSWSPDSAASGAGGVPKLPVPQLTRHGLARGLAARSKSSLGRLISFTTAVYLLGGEAGPQSPHVSSPPCGPDTVLTPPATLLYHNVLKINCPNNSKEKTQLGQKSGDTELGGKLRVAPITVSGPRDVGKTSRL